MCAGELSPSQYRYQFGLDTNVVIEVNEHPLHEDLNYCTFNEHFRSRYYDAQLRLGRIVRPSSEFWIAVHFRWGDTSTQDPEKPNGRAGKGLTAFAQATAVWVKANPDARVYFLSEGSEETFSTFRRFVPHVNLQLNGDWRDALWTMAQSNVLLGGSSSFFALGAHLCHECTVATTKRGKSGRKFRATVSEKNSTRHHHLVEIDSFIPREPNPNNSTNIPNTTLRLSGG